LHAQIDKYQRVGGINQKLTIVARAGIPWLSCKKMPRGGEAMIGRLARGAYMLIVAGMIVAWAMSASKSSPAEPKNDQVVESWWC
jgi:hypothetical protein